MRPKHTPGFTIVELLVVIVVIAVLATITLITYQGIQTRTENTKTNQAVAQYAKALQSYKAINGAYPSLGPACTTGASTVCGNVAAATGACFSVGQYSGSGTLDAILATVITALPQPSTVASSCGGGSYRGIFYDTTSGGRLVWFLIGSGQSCSGIGGTYNSNSSGADNTTRCLAILP